MVKFHSSRRSKGQRSLCPIFAGPQRDPFKDPCRILKWAGKMVKFRSSRLFRGQRSLCPIFAGPQRDPCKVQNCGFGDIHGPKPCKLIRFGDIHGPKPYKLIRCGDIHGPKPYKFTGFGPPPSLPGGSDILGAPMDFHHKQTIRSLVRISPSAPFLKILWGILLRILTGWLKYLK